MSHDGSAHLARLAAVSAQASGSGSVDDVAEAIVRAAVDGLQAAGAALGVVDERSGLIRLVAHQGYAEAAQAVYASPTQRSFPLADVLARQEAVWISDRAELETGYPILADLVPTLEAGGWLPIPSAGRSLAALGVVFDRPRVLASDERAFLTGLAAIAGVALEADDEPVPGRRPPIVLALRPDAALDQPSPSWQEVTGQTSVEAANLGWLEQVHPDERAAVLELARSRESAPGPAGMTLRLRHADSDRWRHTRADFVAVADSRGEVTEVVAAFADVNDRLAAEGQLAGLGRLLDSFLTGSPVGFALIDPELRFEVVNETMAGANQVAVDDHIGRRVRDVSAPLGELIEPLLQRVLDTGEPLLGLELSGGPDPDGGLDRDWLVNYFPVRRPDGSLRGVGATTVDITERNRTEAMVRDLQERQARDRFRAALDIMRDSVAIDVAIRDDRGTIVDFRIEYLNPVVNDLAGRERDELVGATMLESWPDMAGSRLFASYVRTVETGEAFIDNHVRYEVVVDGVPITGYYAIQALRFGDGLLICSRDITAEREADLRLREAEVELGVEHRIVERLQHALLPPRLPEADDFELAACYNPVDERAELGGDWYDAFALQDGRIGLSIGDVTGHGLDAAALMAQIRVAMRAYAFDTARSGDPAAVIEQLDRLLDASAPGELATAIYAIYDPASGRLQWCRAGHPLPILSTFEREAASVVSPGGPPLGSRLVESYPTCEMQIDEGAVVMLYTDGLIERRGEPLDDGIVEVCERLHSAEWDDLTKLCDALTESVREGFVREDDVCILALRRSPPQSPDPQPLEALDIRVPAQRDAQPAVRRAVTGWLAPLELAETELWSVQVVVSELVANAVEAARADEEIAVALAEVGGLVSVEVVNPSRRSEPVVIPDMADPLAVRGRGLAIVRALAENLELTEVEGHTVARCTVRLSPTTGGEQP